MNDDDQVEPVAREDLDAEALAGELLVDVHPIAYLTPVFPCPTPRESSR